MNGPNLEPNPKDSLPPSVVREYQHRRVRTPVLLTATVGLTVALVVIYALHPTLSRMPNWQRVGWPWLLTLAATAAACAIVWRWRRVSPSEVARELDRQWAAKNRLEAATELVDQNSPLTAAQHAEAAEFLSRAPKQRFRFDLLFLALATVLLLAHLGTATMWIEQSPKAQPPAIPTATIQWKSPKAEIKATPIEAVPLVAIAQSTTGLRNLSLYVAINGEPRKPVPLTVDKIGKAGSVEIKTSMLLDEFEVEPYDIISYYLQADRIYSEKLKPTTSTIQFVQVRPFRDDALTGKPGQPKKSGMVDFLGLLLKLKISQLLLMKQNFVLANADIDHHDAAFHEENERVGKDQNILGNKTDEIKRLGISIGVPTLVIDKLGEAEPLMREASGKILAVKNLDALPQQGKALAAIIAIEKIIRKIIGLPLPGQAGNPPLKDPFAEEQRFKLKPRETMSAGQLEMLARQQGKLVSELKKSSGAQPLQDGKGKDQQAPKPGQQMPQPETGSQQASNQPGTQPVNNEPGQDQSAPQGQPDNEPGQQPADGQQQGQGTGAKPPGDEGTLAQRQDAIREALSKLANEAPFDPDVIDLIRHAAGHAGVSNQQLEANDMKAALEPATAALRDLQKAIQLMSQHGRDQAKEMLANAQALLNVKAAEVARLKGQAGSGISDQHQKTAEELAKLKEELRKLAEKQQESGSSSAAQALAKLVNGLADPTLKKNLETLTKDPGNIAASEAVSKKLSELASQSASGQAGFERDPSKALQEAIARLESGKASLARLAGKDQSSDSTAQATREILAQMQVDVQVASSLATSSAVQSHSDELKRKLELTYATAMQVNNKIAPLKEIAGPVDELISLLKQSMAEVTREEFLRQADLDEAPEMYRDAVSSYLEGLSLDYEKPAPAKPAETRAP